MNKENTRRRRGVLGFLALSLSFFGCGGSYAPLPTVDRVDLTRYLGKWYEIARTPNRFQKECAQSTAEYSVIDDETIRVVNRCVQRGGGTDEAVGKAFVVPNSGGARLKVQFFWPFRGDYWIIALDTANYSYAMVGAPSRKYLWILARDPHLDDEVFEQLKALAVKRGFDVSQLLVFNEPRR